MMPAPSSRTGSPSPATRPVRARRRGAPRARPGGVLARVGGARGAGRRQARAPAGAEWHGVGGRGRWKRPFDFPILGGKICFHNLYFTLLHIV